MRIFKRISCGMFNPSEVNFYVNDKKIFTIFFAFILVVLMSLPQAIYSLTRPLLTYEDKTEVRESFYHDTEHIPFYIAGNILFHSDHDTNYIYQKAINEDLVVVIRTTVDNQVYTNTQTTIELTRTGVFLHQYGIKKLLFSYSDYSELKNIDITKAYDNDNDFWEIVFDIVDKEVDKYETAARVISVISIFIGEATYLLVLSFVLTLFNRGTNRRGLKFTKIWQMAIYMMSPYVFGGIIAETFGIVIVYYIGLIWSMINVGRFSNTIVLRGEDNEL